MKNIACLLARPEYVVTRMVFALRTTTAAVRARAVASNDAMAEAVAGSFCRSLWEGAGVRGCGCGRGAYTLSGFPIADALLTQPPANGEKDGEKEGGYSSSPPLASVDEPVKEAISHARAAFGPFFLPPSSQSLHEMPIRYCYTRRGERRYPPSFLPSHAAPHNDFGATASAPAPAAGRGRDGGGAPCRGWAIYS